MVEGVKRKEKPQEKHKMVFDICKKKVDLH